MCLITGVVGFFKTRREQQKYFHFAHIRNTTQDARAETIVGVDLTNSFARRARQNSVIVSSWSGSRRHRICISGNNRGPIEAELFGIRALEAGFCGGVTQSKDIIATVTVANRQREIIEEGSSTSESSWTTVFNVSVDNNSVSDHGMDNVDGERESQQLLQKSEPKNRGRDFCCCERKREPAERDSSQNYLSREVHSFPSMSLFSSLRQTSGIKRARSDCVRFSFPTHSLRRGRSVITNSVLTRGYSEPIISSRISHYNGIETREPHMSTVVEAEASPSKGTSRSFEKNSLLTLCR